MKLSDLYTEDGKARYDKNWRKHESLCDLCGRPLKDRKFYVVEHYETGELLLNSQQVFSGEHCVYLGSECAKRPELKPFVRKG